MRLPIQHAFYMDPNDLAALVIVARYSSGDTLAGMSLVVYDWLLMLPKEIQYIWRARWTPGKVLYLIIRYLPFVDFPMWPFDDAMLSTGTSPVNCNFILYWVLISLLVSDALAGIVYGLRTWAIWNRNRVMGVFLGITWVGIYAGVAIYEAVFQTSSSDTTIPGFWGCFFLYSPADSSWEGYTLAMVYQMVIFLATVIKGIQHLRHEPARVTSVLYRDALMVAIIQLGIGVANIIILRITHQPNWSLNATFRALASILPARIILNLREAATSLDRWDVTFLPRDTTLIDNAGTVAWEEGFASRAPGAYELEDMANVVPTEAHSEGPG